MSKIFNNIIYHLANNTSVRVTLGTLSIGYAYTRKIGTICQISGTSMEPTYSHSDWIYVNKFNVFPVQRGNIYLLKSDINKIQIKRLIGKENDIIKPRRKQHGRHNSRSKDDDDDDDDINERIDTNLNYFEKIKRGFIWVEGDNYHTSKDSNSYGQVPINCIEGKVLFKINNPFSSKNEGDRKKKKKKKFVINEDKYFLKVD